MHRLPRELSSETVSHWCACAQEFQSFSALSLGGMFPHGSAGLSGEWSLYPLAWCVSPVRDRVCAVSLADGALAFHAVELAPALPRWLFGVWLGTCASPARAWIAPYVWFSRRDLRGSESGYATDYWPAEHRNYTRVTNGCLGGEGSGRWGHCSRWLWWGCVVGERVGGGRALSLARSLRWRGRCRRQRGASGLARSASGRGLG